MTPKIGFIEWFHFDDRDHVERALRELRRLDVDHLRTGLSWADWHRPGAEKWYDWLVGRLAAEVDLVPCFSYTPPSLGMEPRTSAPPRDPDQYAGFVGQMIARYGDAFEWVELWNEPNNRAEWDWTLDPDYRRFAHMATTAAVCAHGYGKKVLLGGLSPIDPTFLAHLGNLGLLNHVDAVGLHGFPGTWERNWNGWTREIERIREVLGQFGVTPEIWGTEIGFSTRAHRETEQLEAFLEAVEQPFERLYWYALEDLHPDLAANSGFHQDDREYHNGILKVDGRSKLLHRLWSDLGVARLHEAAWLTRAPEVAADERPVLITGGAGFVGTNLAHRLITMGRPVILLDDLSRVGTYRNLAWLRREHGEQARIKVASVLDERAVQGVVKQASAVFHLAAQVAVTTSLDNPYHDFETNARGTMLLLDALRRRGEDVPLVFTSTNKVYGSLPHLGVRERGLRCFPEDPLIDARGLDETQPLSPCTPYGCSKAAADSYVLDHARMYGMPSLSFRMSCIYGPHQHGTEDQGWVAHFLLRAAAGEPITVYGDGRQVRDVLYVDDLVDAFLAAERNAPRLGGRAFNIGGGPNNTLSLLELIQHITRTQGASPVVRHAPMRAGDQIYYVSDPAAFQQATGWEPKIGVDIGLRRLQHWIQHGDIPRQSAVEALMAEGSP